MRSGLKVLPLVGAGSLLLAHMLSAAAFRRRTNAMITCLEQASATELSTTSVPSVIQSFARRAVCENPVPNTVWLSQRGELRANLRDPWRPFTAEQVISVHQPGFAWLARMQAAPLVSARVLDCYVDGAGLLEARLFGSLRLARAAGPEPGRSGKGAADLRERRYYAHRGRRPLACGRTPHCSDALAGTLLRLSRDG